jgi:hypothetical protein
VSRRLISHIVLVGLLLLGALSLRTALATADSLTGIDAQSLLPSETPALLGPINEKGRTGWACRPERAAGASAPHDAELPLADPR